MSSSSGWLISSISSVPWRNGLVDLLARDPRRDGLHLRVDEHAIGADIVLADVPEPVPCAPDVREHMAGCVYRLSLSMSRPTGKPAITNQI